MAVIAWVPCAEGGADVLVLPGAIGPFDPGQDVKVRIYLRQDPGGAIRAIRQLRFDFTQSDSSLTLTPCDGCQTFCNVVEPFFSFRECLTGGQQADPGRHTQTVPLNDLRAFPPKLVYDGGGPNLIQQIILPTAGCLDPTPTTTELLCLPVAKFSVRMPTRPGTYLLDVLNAADPDPSAGATLEFGFQPPDDPIDPHTVWTAFTGELRNGQVLVSVICIDDTECADGNPCTDDICSDGVCSNDNNVSPCDDGQFCTTADTCDNGACIGFSFCPILCDEQGALCVTCLDDTDCNDDIPCTADVCVDGNCANTPDQPGCNDVVCSGPLPDCNDNCRNDAEDLSFGSSEDCNENGIPDECDIDACNGQAFCDDCNLNGSPDICDDPLDALPNACVDAGPGIFWSQDIWGLIGLNPFPDDLFGAFGQRVTLGAQDNLLLDVDVQIPTLRLTNGGTLSVTSPIVGDLTIVEPGGVVVEGPSPPGFGLVAGNGRRINILNGPLVITRGGRFGPPVGQTAADDEVDSHTCTKGLVIDDKNGSRASVHELRGESSLYVEGDIVVDGTGATTCEPDSDAAGVPCVPPIKRTRERAEECVTGDVSLVARVAFERDSGPALLVGGSVANTSICPSRFNFSCGRLTFASPEEVRCTEAALACGAAPCSVNSRGESGPIATHQLEIAGLDLGPVLEGFGLRNATSQNFAMGAIKVKAGSHLVLGDVATNNPLQLAAGTRPEEALYVKILTIEPGASFSIDSGFVYYLRAPGILNCTGGCEQLTAVHCEGPNGDEVCDRRDLADFQGGPGLVTCLQSGPNGLLDPGCELFDLACDDHIDLKDIAVFFAALGSDLQK